MLEIDTNPNPLRENLVQGLMPLSEGRMTLSQRPGLGIADDLEGIVARAR
jgi:hypothetical protein